MKEKKLKAHLDELGLKEELERRESPWLETSRKVCRGNLRDEEDFGRIEISKEMVENQLWKREAGCGSLVVWEVSRVCWNCRVRVSEERK